MRSLNSNFFFIAGGQRCGSTYLYHLLDAHPEIEMAKPIKPEPKFFINESDFRKGKDYYLSKFFSNYSHAKTKCIGEKSTSYMEYAFVPQRVLNCFPEAKALVILRNPIDRAISNYFFSLNNKLETRTLREVFIDRAPVPVLEKQVSVSPFNYLQRGMYNEYLKPYQEAFVENLKVILFEEIISNDAIITDLYNFLGVDVSFKPEKRPINSSDTTGIDLSDLSEVKELLRHYYRNEVKLLKEVLKRDLTVWDFHD